MNKRNTVSTIALLMIAIAVIILYASRHSDDTNNSESVVETKPISHKPQYIGNKTCVVCHKQQSGAWQGSHHDLAMQHVTVETVLGDFTNATLSYNDITTTFFTKDNKYYVNTDGPDGKLQTYPVLYTFGVTPLQQYLINIGGGRLQALGIAWDSRPKEAGGQRWFHLYPDEKIDHQDRLHWTKRDQNWNYMCAECHSTNLKKNYNPEDDTYRTKWSEVDVSCEACHGPASSHLSWANKKPGWDEIDGKGFAFNLDEREGVTWLIDPASGNARRSKTKSTNKEIEMCAQCHSRRSVINDDHKPGTQLMSNYRPAILDDFLYYHDGQIKEEVYVYGSFIQSKMFHQGVTCSDCHEPHSLGLRAEGNGVCLQCHQQQKYVDEKHHFHQPGSEGAQCAECHMPQTKYMVVDGRHDHSIRIPRPDLSVKLNTPNACNQCHTEKTAQWAATQMEQWYGKDWIPGWHFGETLYEARTGVAGAGQDLAAVAASPKLPNIVRATAASMLAEHPGRLTFTITPRLLKDKGPQVRLAALQTLDSFPMEQRLKLGMKMLSDPVRAIRIEAALIMSVVPADSLSPPQAKQLQKAVEEYRQAQLANAERPESYINLGLLSMRLQQYQQAEAYYNKALELDAAFTNAHVNLADLYRAQGDDSKAKDVLDKAKSIAPDDAAIRHSLGLLQVRLGNNDSALAELSKAVELQPNNSRYRYVYAIALHSVGKIKQAIAMLEELLSQSPGYRDGLSALITYTQQTGDNDKATLYAEKLLQLVPELGSVGRVLKYHK